MDILCFPVVCLATTGNIAYLVLQKAKKLCQNGLSNNVCNFATFSKSYIFKTKYHEKFDIDMTFLIME